MTDFSLDVLSYEPVALTAWNASVKRSIWLPLWFMPSILICGISWLMDGAPRLTDLGFIYLTCACIVLLANELVRFPSRLGLGGIVLFGGCLVWFCHDYMTNWLGEPFVGGVRGVNSGNGFGYDLTSATVAKAAFFYSIFICCMTIGLLLPWGKMIERIILMVPEPGNPKLYLIVLLGTLFIGIIPYALFAKENFLLSLFKGAFGTWAGPVEWTVGRTGNFNYSWGAYVSQLLQIGVFSGMLAAFYAVFVARSMVGRIFGGVIWLYWTLYSFGGTRRGDMAAMVLPVIGFIFLKYIFKATIKWQRPKHSIRAYILCFVIAFLLWAVVKMEGEFRNAGVFGLNEIENVDLTGSAGNLMFSEGLYGFQLIPDPHMFFCNQFLGEGIIRPIPETLFWFFVSPMPRALWTTKPEDQSMIWYNAIITNRVDGREGTTVSQGIVGHWYFRYGPPGVIEGGMLIGLLMGIVERVLRRSTDKPIGILISLVLAAWLFRIYRNFYFIELDGWIIGAIAMTIFVYLSRPFASASPQQATA